MDIKAEEIENGWVTGRSMQTEINWKGIEFIAEFKNGERHRIVGYMDENCEGEISVYLEDADNDYCTVDEDEVVRWKILERENISPSEVGVGLKTAYNLVLIGGKYIIVLKVLKL